MEKRFTKSHEWIEIAGRKGTVGITQYAKQELGDVVHVQLPKIGDVVHAGEEVSVMESTKAAVDLYSPVSGTILDSNESVAQNPQLLDANTWLFIIELSNLEEVDSLLSKIEYEQLFSH